MFSAALFLAFLAAQAATPAQAPGSLTLAVKGAGSRGTLTFTADGIAFQAADAKKSRRWPYRELKQIRIVAPRKIAFDTFEDRALWRFGADRTITFDVSAGTIDSGLVAFLFERVARPIATAVMPAGLGEPEVSVAAKHLRARKGTHGSLVIYAAGLAYAAQDATASRFWRFRDIRSIQRTGPYGLLIDVFEHGRVRAFAFELKEPMPAVVFDRVWDRVNPPANRPGDVR